MVVVDSSAWIEWLTESPLAPEISLHMPERDEIVVPTLVQLELVKWLRRERSEEAADEMLALTQMCNVVPLTTAIAIEAAGLCRIHQLSTADAVILATARHESARLLTCDKHFNGLSDVHYIGKPGSTS
jgi:predicted nucleic acid-binding protein